MRGDKGEGVKVYLQQITDLQESDNSRNFSLMLSSSAKPRDCVRACVRVCACVCGGGEGEYKRRWRVRERRRERKENLTFPLMMRATCMYVGNMTIVNIEPQPRATQVSHCIRVWCSLYQAD